MIRLWRLASRLPRPIRRGLDRVPGASGIRRMAAARPSLPGPPSGSRRAIVYPPTWLRWDEMQQRPQYLLAALARAGHDVYFVDPRSSLEHSLDGVRIVPSLAAVPASGVILYVHYAPVFDMADLFDGPITVYDILDDLTIYDGSEDHLPRHRRVRHHHGGAVVDADVVTVSSDVLAERHRSERPDLLLVKNGVDPERFKPERRSPPDLVADGRPIVGYHGAVAPWFAFDLLNEVVEQLSQYRFVIIGPIDDAVAAEAVRLAQHANVELLSTRSSDEIADYVAMFDVGIIPFVVDTMTAAVSPLKMYEYLAAGIPCVATPLPECVDEPLVTSRADADGFVAAIVAACEETTDAGREAFVDAGRDADWNGRAADIIARLDDLGMLRV